MAQQVNQMNPDILKKPTDAGAEFTDGVPQFDAYDFILSNAWEHLKNARDSMPEQRLPAVKGLRFLPITYYWYKKWQKDRCNLYA